MREEGTEDHFAVNRSPRNSKQTAGTRIRSTTGSVESEGLLLLHNLMKRLESTVQHNQG
jgi:hypothetical protein